MLKQITAINTLYQQQLCYSHFTSKVCFTFSSSDIMSLDLSTIMLKEITAYIRL